MNTSSISSPPTPSQEQQLGSTGLRPRAVTTNEGALYAKQNGLLYIETSAKEGWGVVDAFEWTARQVLQRHNEEELTRGKVCVFDMIRLVPMAYISESYRIGSSWCERRMLLAVSVGCDRRDNHPGIRTYSLVYFPRLPVYSISDAYQLSVSADRAQGIDVYLRLRVVSAGALSVSQVPENSSK